MDELPLYLDSTGKDKIETSYCWFPVNEIPNPKTHTPVRKNTLLQTGMTCLHLRYARCGGERSSRFDIDIGEKSKKVKRRS